MRIHKIQESSSIDFYTADATEVLSLPYADGGISAGFPSPANDYIDLSLDLNKALIRNPSSTFYGRVKGLSMKDAGIDEGDLLIIDKSISPYTDALAVCFLEGEFTLKKIRIENEGVWLIPANPDFQPILIKEDRDFVVWGIVTYVIKKMG